MIESIESVSEEKSEHLIRSLYVEIITPPNFTIKQFKIFVLTYLTIMMEGIQLSIFALMLIPIKRYFDLSENMIIISSVVMFVAFAMGSFFSGFFVHRFGRKKSCLVFMMSICVLNI